MAGRYYVPGQGWFEGEPNTYQNQQGQTVVQSAGVLRNNDGSLHAAYRFQPQGSDLNTTYLSQGNQGFRSATASRAASGASNYARIQAIKAKLLKGFPITEEERRLLAEYNRALATLPTVDDLGGNHNGGITTKPGTPNKNTVGGKSGGSSKSTAAKSTAAKQTAATVAEPQFSPTAWYTIDNSISAGQSSPTAWYTDANKRH